MMGFTSVLRYGQHLPLHRCIPNILHPSLSACDIFPCSFAMLRGLQAIKMFYFLQSLVSRDQFPHWFFLHPHLIGSCFISGFDCKLPIISPFPPWLKPSQIDTMGSIDTPTITKNGSTQSHAAVELVGDDQKPLASFNGAPELEATKKRRSSILPLEVVNRRLDEWVKLEQLDLDSVETIVYVKVEDKVTSLKMTRRKKRKIDETHVEVGHEELDAANLREHEEFTKVKNISTIELGRYEIETWYFPPFHQNIMIH
ncbi:Histone acetyltransferase of the MYST family 1 [Hibiscus syriacus]|uniref:Histone acetyltransferase n=1 Tax=Hibiscus syriacus TaxID=106335 RepID=A0A6A2XCX1_HIBSY|nr:Histone acetyltransferase of the MYST family 1 [Hibiscus syriacus]